MGDCGCEHLLGGLVSSVLRVLGFVGSWGFYWVIHSIVGRIFVVSSVMSELVGLSKSCDDGFS